MAGARVDHSKAPNPTDVDFIYDMIVISFKSNQKMSKVIPGVNVIR